jgi:hypothetical protein
MVTIVHRVATTWYHILFTSLHHRHNPFTLRSRACSRIVHVPISIDVGECPHLDVEIAARGAATSVIPSDPLSR